MRGLKRHAVALSIAAASTVALFVFTGIRTIEILAVKYAVSSSD